MMEIFFTFKPTQKIRMVIRLWQRLTRRHWLLVVPLQLLIRLKHLIFQPTLGLKLQIILIILSKFS